MITKTVEITNACRLTARHPRSMGSRVHHEVDIVKNVVSFAHAQVDFALILAYNQYDKIDK